VRSTAITGTTIEKICVCGTGGGEEFSIKQKRKRPCNELKAEIQLTSVQEGIGRETSNKSTTPSIKLRSEDTPTGEICACTGGSKELNTKSRRPCADPAPNVQATIKRDIINKPTVPYTEIEGEARRRRDRSKGGSISGAAPTRGAVAGVRTETKFASTELEETTAKTKPDRESGSETGIVTEPEAALGYKRRHAKS
jgi:hypothetical protein